MRSVFALICVLQLGTAVVRGDDWPQYLGPKRDGIWREVGILETFPAGGPKTLWRTPVGAGYSGPSVVGDRLYVSDRVKPEGKSIERVLCVDVKSGNILWKQEYAAEYGKIGYPSGPRCTPLVHDGLVYALGATGELVCLDADKGGVVWRKNYVSDFKARTPIWGFACHPIIDGDRLIAVTGGSEEKLVVAFDRKTGKEIWASQSIEADCGYAPVMICDFAGTRTAVVWHGKGVVGLDPANGKRLWYQPFDVKYALTAPMPRQLDGNRLFVTAFYDGPMMLKVGDKSVAVEWKGNGKGETVEKTDKLHSIMPAPFVVDGHIYGVCSYGELRCIKADTGERVWETRIPTVGQRGVEGKPTRWGNAFMIRHADRFFLFNEQGELIIAKLTPKGYEEIDRAAIIRPDNKLAGRPVVWVQPAFANRKMYVRNDSELVCIDLSK